MRTWDLIYKTRGEVQKKVIPKIVKIVPYLKRNKIEKILDLGCGAGRHSIFLAKGGFDVVATDISSNALKILKEKIKYEKIKNIKIKKHDMSSIPFSDNYFDAVICVGVLPHGTINKISKTIEEVHRVLKNKGMFFTDFMSTKDPDYKMCKSNPKRYREIEPNTFLGLEEEEDTPHHYVSRDEVIRLFSRFKIIKLEHKTHHISYKTRKNRAAQFHIIAKAIK